MKATFKKKWLKNSACISSRQHLLINRLVCYFFYQSYIVVFPCILHCFCTYWSLIPLFAASFLSLTMTAFSTFCHHLFLLSTLSLPLSTFFSLCLIIHHSSISISISLARFLHFNHSLFQLLLLKCIYSHLSLSVSYSSHTLISLTTVSQSRQSSHTHRRQSISLWVKQTV